VPQGKEDLIVYDIETDFCAHDLSPFDSSLFGLLSGNSLKNVSTKSRYSLRS
jgi:hypothetical protein